MRWNSAQRSRAWPTRSTPCWNRCCHEQPLDELNCWLGWVRLMKRRKHPWMTGHDWPLFVNVLESTGDFVFDMNCYTGGPFSRWSNVATAPCSWNWVQMRSNTTASRDLRANRKLMRSGWCLKTEKQRKIQLLDVFWHIQWTSMISSEPYTKLLLRFQLYLQSKLVNPHFRPEATQNPHPLGRPWPLNVARSRPNAPWWTSSSRPRDWRWSMFFVVHRQKRHQVRYWMDQKSHIILVQAKGLKICWLFFSRRSRSWHWWWTVKSHSWRRRSRRSQTNLNCFFPSRNGWFQRSFKHLENAWKIGSHILKTGEQLMNNWWNVRFWAFVNWSLRIVIYKAAQILVRRQNEFKAGNESDPLSHIFVDIPRMPKLGEVVAFMISSN